MNDDTHLVSEVLANDEILYQECESAATYAAFVSDSAEDFHAELAGELRRIAEDNRELMMFSKTESVEFENVDYDELAAEYQYEDYE